MAADLDFSNITNYIELTPGEYDSEALYYKVQSDGTPLYTTSQTCWDIEAPSVGTADQSGTLTYPCLGILKLKPNLYYVCFPARTQDSNYLINFNTALTTSWYDGGQTPQTITFSAGLFPAFTQLNGYDNQLSANSCFTDGNIRQFKDLTWAQFESLLELAQTNDSYFLTNQVYSCATLFTATDGTILPNSGNYGGHTASCYGMLHIDTNIPIFLISDENTFNAWIDFYLNGTQSALNYAWDGSSGAVVNPKNLFYHIKYRIESRDQYGQNPTYTAWTDKWVVWEETEENAIAAYLDTDEPLSFNVKGANNVACKVSEDGGFTWTEYATAPAEYLNCLWFQGPLADGSGYLRYSTRARNISIYRTEVEANNYIATGEGQQYSIDPEVTNPSADRDPDFGTKEVATTFPASISMTNNTRHVYYLSALQVAAFKAAIFADTVTMETIVEGTQFWASSHLDCVTDTAYYPVDLEALSNTAVSRSNIVMGGYVYQASSSHYEEAGYPGMLDCGSVAYNPVWNDIRDYEPYSQLFIYLPYAGGFHRLNIDKYIGTTVSIKYAIDIDSGKCTAFLLADGILRDYFDGNMAVHMRLSSPDFQQDQLATMQNVTQQIGALAGGVGKAASAAFASPSKNEIEEAPENGLDAVAEVGTRQTFAGLGSGIASASAIGLQMFNANQGGPEFSSGGISPTISQYAPQYPFMIIATRKSVRPEDELNLVGYPSGASGQVGAFSGYLKASAVKLAPMKATKPEQDAIIAALQNGIYL